MSNQVSQNIGNFDSPVESLLDSQALRNFIMINADADLPALRLKESRRSHDFDLDFALTQISARRKCGRKLTKFIQHADFLFPSDIAFQQATHEEVADFHASLIGPGKRILDMTAGLGIDAMTFAIEGDKVTALEIDSWKCDLLRHNSKVLNLDIEVICCDSVSYLRDETGKDDFDWIYADPARRGSDDKRLHGLADCFPDLTPHISTMLECASGVMIKASPLLDIQQIIRDIPAINRIIAVSWHGECKELLLIIRRISDNKREVTDKCVLQAVNITSNGIESFEATKHTSEENSVIISHFTEKDLEESLINGELWLYEPNASIMKLGCWKDIMKRWPELSKADNNTHLFFSPYFIKDFPGRSIKIDRRLTRKESKTLKGRRVTVVSRNFPEEASAIRRRLDLKEGDSEFIYALRTGGTPVMLLGHVVDTNE